MPILDHLISELNDFGIPLREHENIKLRFIENFQAIQHNLSIIFADDHESALDRVVSLLVHAISKEGNTSAPRFLLSELKTNWIGIKPDRSGLSNMGKNTCAKWQKEGYHVLSFDNAFDIGHRYPSYFFRLNTDGRNSREPFFKYLKDALAPNGTAFLFIIIEETHNPSPFIDNWLQLIHACNKIINPDIKILIVGDFDKTGNPWVTRAWYHPASCDGYLAKTFTIACWDAIATQHTALFRHTVDRYLPTMAQGIRLFTIDPGIFSPKLDDEDIVAAGYSPQPHREFLMAWFTGKFKGSISTARLFKTVGRNYVLKASAPGLAGIERGLKVNTREFIETGLKRIKMLETLAILQDGLPVFHDYDLPDNLLKILWQNRIRIMKVIRTDYRKNPMTTIRYLEVNNPHLLVIYVERGNIGSLGIFNFKNSENVIEWDELNRQAQVAKTSKDKAGQKMQWRDGKLPLNPYDYYILNIDQ